jgi:phage FluMu protein Com
MAIRFFCRRCGQLLGIASRKAGTEIDCPTCGLSQTVPNEEAAAAALAMGKSARPRQVVEDPSEIVVYDDRPAAIETTRPRHPLLVEPDPATTPLAESRAAAEPVPQAGPPVLQAARPVPQGMILYRRQTLYVQAVLFVVVAVVGFGSGYFVGRGDATFEEKVRHEQARKQPVLIEGTLLYRPVAGKVEGDPGAVVIALPEIEEPLKKRISIQGLRPQEPPPQASDKSVRAIEQLGGAYARADDSGSFWMQVPEQGKYRLLLISRHAARPKDSEIEELDADQMGMYFTLPRDLVGRNKYRWTREEFDVGSKPTIEYDFRLDGQ